MRAIFSLLGLLLVVLFLGLLAKKQLAPAVQTPQAAVSAQNMPQQVKQAVDAALQQPRAVPDENP
ncbi:MAG: hypothetical protein NTZ15_21845 [Burkholderiales bacterium]|nr:hypothetical protein [Burkholderiales bacterium]